ncbi:hypothetical protein [Kaistella jeonii]|uniref:Uncharacterized protein n=1 Tax=Kaistella jeonii TaxID=266749 RepID=A0A0C1D8M1_9FLAO|nr:hypothetical protein [Kaistella jeonii]KIA90200.1 hypothetical protein OA86_06355 [Kaistella jeonii]
MEKIELIGATIDITQSPTDKKDNGISVDLFDKKGRIIRNDSITIIVNGVEGELYHKQGLYYTDESKYHLSDIPVNDTYTVEIKLTDGQKYILGTIKALSEEKIENIECDERGDLTKNTVIKWKDLKSIDELSIYTSILLKTPPKREDGSDNSKDKYYEYKDEIVKKIRSSGELTFLKSKYVDATSITTGFELEFRTTKSGKMNPKLLKNSGITISTSIKKNINLEKEE